MKRIITLGGLLLGLSQPLFAATAPEGNAEAGKAMTAVCGACHGADGTGSRDFGAPNLTDREWLYGGDRETIRATITNSRFGVMPAWEDRLDPATVRALAIWVHERGGGEE